jgi:hypothetical protein
MTSATGVPTIRITSGMEIASATAERRRQRTWQACSRRSDAPRSVGRCRFEVSRIGVTHPARCPANRHWVRSWLAHDADLQLSSSRIVAELHRSVAAGKRARLPITSGK